MFLFTKMAGFLKKIHSRFVFHSVRNYVFESVSQKAVTRKSSSQSIKPFYQPSKSILLHHYNTTLPLVGYRFKSKSSKSRREENDLDEDEEDNYKEDYLPGRDVNLKTYNVGSLRADLLLKSGLGISRNKIEQLFYESKIRVNGKKITKKSIHISPGDEIDVVKGPSPSNPEFLIVSRVEVLDAKVRDDGEGIHVKMRKTKSLIIENYSDSDAWKTAE